MLKRTQILATMNPHRLKRWIIRMLNSCFMGVSIPMLLPIYSFPFPELFFMVFHPFLLFNFEHKNYITISYYSRLSIKIVRLEHKKRPSSKQYLLL